MPPIFAKLQFKVIANAPRTEWAGRLGEAIKVRVKAPALEGRANDELCRWLSDRLGISRQKIRIDQGKTSCRKTVRIEGLGGSP